MRLFFALSLPQEIKEKLFVVQKEFWQYNLPVRWTDKENFHLTLAFLGWQEEEKLKILERIGENIAQKIGIFSLSLKEVGCFPHKENPRVIWVGLEKSEELEFLYQLLQKELEKSGFFVEKRPFSPHLTLGRAKSRIKNFSQILSKIDISFLKGLSFRVFSLDLYQSFLLPKGAEYKIVKSFNFKKQTDDF